MTAADQLALFDPDAVDAARLLQGYLRAAEAAAARADRFQLLGMRGAVAQADRAMAEAVECASAVAIYLDLLQLSGEGGL